MVSRLLPFVLLASTAANAEVYLVLLKGANAVGYYSPEGKLLATVPAGPNPHEMVLSRDGRYLYTVDNGTMRIEQAGQGGNSLSVIDLAARRKIGDIPLGNFRRPHGIALDSKTGMLWVTTELPDQLLMVDPQRRSVLKHLDPRCKTSHMVALGLTAATAYVSCAGSAEVSVVDLHTGRAQLVRTGARPEGSVLSKDGKELYVAARDAALIAVIDTARAQQTAVIPTGKGPVRIALTPDGSQLVYALRGEKKVGFADPRTRTQTDYVLLPYPPVSLSLSPDGALAFASAEEQDTVYVISIRDKKIVRSFQTEPGSHPDPVLVWSGQ